jgi:hypothetical protein
VDEGNVNKKCRKKEIGKKKKLPSNGSIEINPSKRKGARDDQM